LLESEGDGVIQRKRHRRCAEFSPRNSPEVRILREDLIVILSGLDSCARCSCYFGQSNRVVRRGRGWRAVLSQGPYSAEEGGAQQEELIPGSAPHFVSLVEKFRSSFTDRLSMDQPIRNHDTRALQAKQLDDGIGDTFVLVRRGINRVRTPCCSSPPPL
jgi:hypothetical protein